MAPPLWLNVAVGVEAMVMAEAQPFKVSVPDVEVAMPPFKAKAPETVMAPEPPLNPPDRVSAPAAKSLFPKVKVVPVATTKAELVLTVT